MIAYFILTVHILLIDTKKNKSESKRTTAVKAILLKPLKKQSKKARMKKEDQKQIQQ